MSFYNADPRAYFQWEDEVSWDTVWDTENEQWQNLDAYEPGRLIRIINDNSQSSAYNNYQIYTVVVNNGNKELQKLNLTNPYSMAIGENTNANQPNQTVVGKNNAESQNALFIVGNGTVNNGTVTPNNAFEVLDGSDGIKINGKTLKINNQGTLVVNGTDYPSGNGSITIVDGVKFSQTSSGTQEIGKLLKTNGDEWDYGSIKLPTTITEDTTFNGSVTITGTITTTALTLNTHPIIILTEDQYTSSEKNVNTLYIVIPNPSSST